MKANEILRQAAEVIEERGKLRDKPDGERSMLRAICAFNILTGKGMSELDGWLFMSILKIARATAGAPHLDDATDLAGYAALAAECIDRDAKTNAMAEQAGIITMRIDGDVGNIDTSPIPEWQNFSRELPDRSIPNRPAVNMSRCPKGQVCDYCQLGKGKPCYES